MAINKAVFNSIFDALYADDLISTIIVYGIMEDYQMLKVCIDKLKRKETLTGLSDFEVQDLKDNIITQEAIITLLDYHGISNKRLEEILNDKNI